jgi:glycosyltransferase involved in cell wall biosynthesis
LRRWERIPARKLLTIPNGIDGASYDVNVDRRRKKAELGIPDDSLVVGYASRIEPEKNLELLVRAFAAASEVQPRAFLLIAGYGGEQPRLERLVEDLGVGSRVAFLGVRLDVPELLKVFDLHVLPSKREGLPMILLESMAAGCPTVATAVGGVPSVIEDGVNGELVGSEDLGSLVEAVIRLLSREDLRSTYGRNARKTFEARYDARVMTRRYELLYERRADEATLPSLAGE